MKEFDKILQYHIDNNLPRVVKSRSRGLTISQVKQLQACIDLHFQLEDLRVKPAFGRQSLKEVLTELDKPKMKRRFRWSSVKIATTAMASLLIVVAVGGFSLLGQDNKNGVLSSNSVKPNGTVENLQNLNLADAQNDTSTIQSDSNLAKSAEINLAKTSNIDEAVNENF